MTSATLKTTFLTAHMRLSKTFKVDGTTEAYPNASRMTSDEKTYPLTKQGMKERLKDLRFYAKKGGCMLRGNLTAKIENASRAGMTDSDPNNQTLMLDFDKMRLDTSCFRKKKKKGQLEVEVVEVTEKDIINVAEQLIALADLPQNVSYFAHASSSLGMKHDSVSMHIEFVLARSVPTQRQRSWIESRVLTNVALNDALELSKNNLTLKWPLDPSVAHNSKLIYIADPVFELKDMNPVSSERIFFVEKEHLLLDADTIAPLDGSQLAAFKERRIHELRKQRGLHKTSLKTVTVKAQGENLQVFKDVDKMDIEIAYEKGDFVYCNINGGDSHAYYLTKRDPSLMLNFKGEPAFRVKDANPEFFEHLCTIFADEIRKNTTGRAFLRRDSEDKGSIYGVQMNEEGEICSAHALSEVAAEDWCFEMEILKPDNIPMTRFEFDPTQPSGARYESTGAKETEVLNTYVVPTAVKKKSKVDFVMAYDTSVDLLSQHCPATMILLTHVCGDDNQMLKHFINWLANGAQKRVKNRTTFLFQGTQGTGKGIMFEHIIKPLYGEAYTKALTIQSLEEKHSGYLEDLLFLLIDEFRHGDSQATKFLENKIKLFVTDTLMPIRRMGVDTENIKTYFQMVFFSNNYDAIRIPEGDRRINVCPRQERKLTTLFTDAVTQTEQQERIAELIDEIDRERSIFIGAMMTMETSAARASMVIENAAKLRMQQAARTKSEDFQSAVTRADLQYFLEASTCVTLPEQRAELKRAMQGIMLAYSTQMTSGAPSVIIQLKHLAPFYALANDAKSNVAGFHLRKWCERNAIDTVVTEDGPAVRMHFKRNDTLAERIAKTLANKSANNAFGPAGENNEYTA